MDHELDRESDLGISRETRELLGTLLVECVNTHARARRVLPEHIAHAHGRIALVLRAARVWFTLDPVGAGGAAVSLTVVGGPGLTAAAARYLRGEPLGMVPGGHGRRGTSRPRGRQ